MGLSIQELLQSDPEYIRRQRITEEMKALNPQGDAASAIGSLLGRGISNISQGKGFFQSPDYGLQRVSDVQSIMKSVTYDPDNPQEYYKQVGMALQERGYSDIAPLAFNEATKVENARLDRQIKLAQFGEAMTEKKRKTVDYYKKNPEQAEFRLAQLAEIIKNDPGNAAAVQEYEQITRSASEGAIEASTKTEKETLGLEIDRTRLAKYRKELSDSQKFGPAERWDAETDAARKLLSNYNIDPTKPLAGQVNASVLAGPIGGEITNAYERAVRRKTTEGGGPGSAPASAPAAAATRGNDPLGIRPR